MSETNPMPFDVEVTSVSAKLRQGDDFLLLDVRERDEYELANIDGSTLLPLSELSQRAGELEPHRERHIIVYCHHGGRSGQVAEALRAGGFPRVQNMAGGIDQWSQQVDPAVPRY